jgi:serine protease
MRATLLALITILVLSTSAATAEFFDYKQKRTTDSEGRPLYYPNKIYVKISEKAFIDQGKREQILSSGSETLGIQSIDKILYELGQFQVNQAFKQSRVRNEKMQERLLAASDELPKLNDIFLVEFSQPLNARNVLEKLNKNSNVEYAELVPIMYTNAIPNDEKFESLKYLPQIKAEEAWDIHKGEDGTQEVLVGICDTGTDWDHPDLLDNLFQNMGEDADGDGKVIVYSEEEGKWIFDYGDVNGIDDDGNGFVDDFVGWDFLLDDGETQGNDPDDVHGHGTHVAGLACGVTDNTEGISSISWNVKFLPTSHSSPSNKHVVRGYDGIVYLADMGCDIINCSWGGGGFSRANQETIDYATGLGVIVICAAGNDNSPDPHYPSSYANAVSVASVGVDDRKATYSNYGIAIDISAPGGDYSNGGALESTFLDGTYHKYQGTSMASPVAAGLFALVKSKHPNWTADQITRQIIATCDDISEMNPKYPFDMGAGRINAYRALSEQEPEVKQALKLAIDYSYLKDEKGNGDGAAQPGETINLGFHIINFAKFVSADEVTFTIKSEDEDIEILNASSVASIDDDGVTDIGSAFEIKISEYTSSKMVKMTLEAACDDKEIGFGRVMEFEFPINSGGFLVYDGGTNNSFSGDYIADFLEDNDYHYIYTNSFPSSLIGYDAAFLSFGFHTDGSSGAPCQDWMADLIVDYLKGGGKVYFEAGDILGFTQAENEELLSILGLDSTAEGPEEQRIDTLAGNENSIFAGMLFDSYRYSKVYSVDYLEANEAAINTFESPDEVVYGVQFENKETNSKSVVSTIPMINFNDQTMPSTKFEYLARILNFFGYDADYVIPQFDVSAESGNAPLNVKFTDRTASTNELKSWSWDFDGDGVPDSEDQNPEFDFNRTGVFPVTMTVSDGQKTKSTDMTIEVFNGECALKLQAYSRTYARLDTTDDLVLSGPMTFEAWIYPNSLGDYNYGRIFQKGSDNLLLLSGINQLRFLVDTQDGRGDFWSPPNVIEFGKWQHVAVTYDADSIVKMYINGKEQEVNNNADKIAGDFKDNRNNWLYIGNRQGRDRNFDGRIDEFRVWKKALTEEEIRENMRRKMTVFPDELVAYMQFQEGGGNEAENLAKKADCRVQTKWGFGWLEGMIQYDPEDFEACLYNAAQFNVNVIGSWDTLIFDWHFNGNIIQKDDTKYSGLGTNLLTVMNVDDDDIGAYSVIVTDPIREMQDESTDAILSLNLPIEITNQSPQTINIKDGEDYELYVEVEGTEPYEFQWYKNKAKIFEETNRTIKIESAGVNDIGIYYCEITNECGTENSSNIFLDMETGIKEVSKGGLRVYPTIVNDKVNLVVNLEANDRLTISLYDLTGQRISVLKSFSANPGMQTFEIDIPTQRLAKGAYMLNISGKTLQKNTMIQIAK